MMKLENIIWKIALLLVVLSCCTACSDEEAATVEPIYYIGTEVDPSDFYTVSVKVNKTDNEVITDMQSKYDFVVRSTMPVPGDVQITVEPDDALIDTYNEANGTTYVSLPSANYKLIRQAVIKAGSYASSDSISVELLNPKSLVSDDGYLLPLRLASIGGSGAISLNRCVVYIKVNVSVTYPGSMVAHGTQPLDDLTEISRVEWGIDCSAPPYDDSYAINYLLDGDYSSCYFCYIGSATPITLDLLSTHIPKGISIVAGYGYYTFSSYALERFELSVSQDGKKWTSYGDVTIEQPMRDSSAANPFVQYVELKQEMEARYIQLRPLRAYGSYVNLSEIYLYE